MSESIYTPDPDLIPQREKRPITEKQRDNLKKGMEALRAKREALRGEQEHESTATEPEPAPEPQPERQYSKPQHRPAPSPFQRLAKPAAHTPVRAEREPRVVERIVEKQISGSALLDALFFGKK